MENKTLWDQLIERSIPTHGNSYLMLEAAKQLRAFHDALEVIATGDGDPQEIAQQTLDLVDPMKCLPVTM